MKGSIVIQRQYTVYSYLFRIKKKIKKNGQTEGNAKLFEEQKMALENTEAQILSLNIIDSRKK